MRCFIVFLFFLKYLTNENIWSLVELFRQNPRWWAQITSSAYEANLDRRMLDRILDAVDEIYMTLYLLQFVLSPFL